MRKNKSLIFFALILIVVMMSGVLVGCSSKGKTDISVGGNDVVDAQTYILNGANSYTYFVLKSQLGLSEVQDLVTVKVASTGAEVDVTIQQFGNGYIVYAPANGYNQNGIYSITVGKGVTFADYQSYNKIIFTVNGDSVTNIKLKANVVQYDKNALAGDIEIVSEANAQGVAIYTMLLNTNGIKLDKGTIIYIYGEDELSAAYKVITCNSTPDLAWMSITVETPEIEEVFDEFQYKNTDVMEEDYIDFVEELSLDDSALAEAAFSIFGSAPEFGFDFSYSDGMVYVTITMTIPNVVQVEGFGSTSLVITIANEMSVEAVSNLDIKNLKDMLNEKSFNLYADVNNKMTTTVSLASNASYESISNLDDIINKLRALSKSQEDEIASVTIFTWTLPIANGVASISYNAQLVFRFNFSGDLNITAVATMSYECGAIYTLEDGLNVYQSAFKFEMVSVQAKMQGSATLRIGIAQTVSLDILAGVLGVGIRAELGNFNTIYGALLTDNFIVQNDSPVQKTFADCIAGGIYFEGGFYYDLDLTYGVKIGSLLNLTGTVDIIADDMVLYTAGERYVDLGIDGIKQVANYVITADETLMPAYYTEMYDLKTGETAPKAVDPSKLTFITDADWFVIDNGILTIIDSKLPIGETVYADVAVVYGGDTVVTKVSYSTATPILSKSFFSVDKANAADIAINVKVSGTPEITVDGIEEAKITGKTVVLPMNKLLQLPNGENTITINVGDYALNVVVTVAGTVDLYAHKTVSGAYNVFTEDQMLQMIAESKNTDFAGVVFTITDDINMNGANIAPIANFAGTIQGSGYKIYNYTVTEMAGNNAALIAVNNGIIESLVAAGNVDVSYSAKFTSLKTKTEYNIAGLVAVNNGKLTNSTYTGSVKATNTSLAAFIKTNVGGLTAVNNGDITGSKVENASITAVTKFDLLNNDIYVGGLTSTNKAGSDVTMSVECEVGAKNPIITKYYFATK